MSGRSPPPLVAVVAALAILVPVTWMWSDSLMPSTWSVEDMGYPDYGGGPAAMSMAGPSVETLRAPAGRPTSRSPSSPAPSGPPCPRVW